MAYVPATEDWESVTDPVVDPLSQGLKMRVEECYSTERELLVDGRSPNSVLIIMLKLCCR